MGPPFQGYRRKAFCKIVINGQDVTDRIEPFLISVTVNEREEGSDTFSLELDDRDAKLAIPPEESVVSIYLGWDPQGPRVTTEVKSLPATPVELAWEGGFFQVFYGFVSTVQSGFTRRGGRRLWVEGRGQDELAKGKTPDEEHSNTINMTFGAWMKMVATNAGYDLKVAPELSSIMRRDWHKNESFLQYGARIASQLGGVFKVTGKTAYITNLIGGTNIDGTPAGTVYAYSGVNMISWRIRPFVAKPQAKEATAQMFNNWFAEYQSIIGAIPGSTPFGGSDASFSLPGRVPYAGFGDQTNYGQSTGSQSQRGRGWVLINGEPLAKCGRDVVVQGARPGVDGAYTISECEHTYSRNGGYTTRCELRNPRVGDSGYEHWVKTGVLKENVVPSDIAGQQNGLVQPPMSQEDISKLPM